MTRAWWAAAAMAVAGCSSLVSDPCATGYVMQQGACVARIAELDGGTDSGGGSGPDGGSGHRGHDGGTGSDGDGGTTVADAGPAVDASAPDALVCTLPTIDCDGTCVDAQTDPLNCGRCGHVCPTDICQAGVCVGAIQGHVVAIGHDYATHDGAMARVLGNAIGLGDASTVRVGWYRGTATAGAASGSMSAAASALAAMGRPHQDSVLTSDPDAEALGNLDVLVVEAQTGSGGAATATGRRWAPQISPFLAQGGVIVVLEGAGGVSYDLAAGAGLYTVAAPVTVTDQQVVLVDGNDAVAQQVPTPYLALGSSVSFGAQPAVFTTTAGATVVFHLTR